jgi:hypothetical protein
MKIIVVGYLLICFSGLTQKPDRFIYQPQTNGTFLSISKNPFPTVVDASFPGGFEAFQNFMKTNIVHPESLVGQSIFGKIYVRFVVEVDGTINDVTILRGIPDYPECDKEIIRLFQSMPKWIPAVDVKNRVVKTYYKTHVTIRTF